MALATCPSYCPMLLCAFIRFLLIIASWLCMGVFMEMKNYNKLPSWGRKSCLKLKHVPLLMQALKIYGIKRSLLLNLLASLHRHTRHMSGAREWGFTQVLSLYKHPLVVRGWVPRQLVGLAGVRNSWQAVALWPLSWGDSWDGPERYFTLSYHLNRGLLLLHQPHSCRPSLHHVRLNRISHDCIFFFNPT